MHIVRQICYLVLLTFFSSPQLFDTTIAEEKFVVAPPIPSSNDLVRVEIAKDSPLLEEARKAKILEANGTMAIVDIVSNLPVFKKRLEIRNDEISRVKEVLGYFESAKADMARRYHPTFSKPNRERVKITMHPLVAAATVRWQVGHSYAVIEENSMWFNRTAKRLKELPIEAHTVERQWGELVDAYERFWVPFSKDLENFIESETQARDHDKAFQEALQLALQNHFAEIRARSVGSPTEFKERYIQSEIQTQIFLKQRPFQGATTHDDFAQAFETLSKIWRSLNDLEQQRTSWQKYRIISLDSASGIKDLGPAIDKTITRPMTESPLDQLAHAYVDFLFPRLNGFLRTTDLDPRSVREKADLVFEASLLPAQARARLKITARDETRSRLFLHSAASPAALQKTLLSIDILREIKSPLIFEAIVLALSAGIWNESFISDIKASLSNARGKFKLSFTSREYPSLHFLQEMLRWLPPHAFATIQDGLSSWNPPALASSIKEDFRGQLMKEPVLYLFEELGRAQDELLGSGLVPLSAALRNAFRIRAQAHSAAPLSEVELANYEESFEVEIADDASRRRRTFEGLVRAYMERPEPTVLLEIIEWARTLDDHLSIVRVIDRFSFENYRRVVDRLESLFSARILWHSALFRGDVETLTSPEFQKKVSMLAGRDFRDVMQSVLAQIELEGNQFDFGRASTHVARLLKLERMTIEQVFRRASERTLASDLPPADKIQFFARNALAVFRTTGDVFETLFHLRFVLRLPNSELVWSTAGDVYGRTIAEILSALEDPSEDLRRAKLMIYYIDTKLDQSKKVAQTRYELSQSSLDRLSSEIDQRSAFLTDKKEALLNHLKKFKNICQEQAKGLPEELSKILNRGEK